MKFVPNGLYGPFFGCSRFPDCRGTHGATKYGEPLGTPGNKECREARKTLMEKFHEAKRASLNLPDSEEDWALYCKENSLNSLLGAKFSDIAHRVVVAELNTCQCLELAKHLDKKLNGATIWERILDESRI